MRQGKGRNQTKDIPIRRRVLLHAWLEQKILRRDRTFFGQRNTHHHDRSIHCQSAARME